MKIYQLFREYIPEELYHCVLYAFGLNEGINSFTRDDLIKKNTLEKMIELEKELYHYYLPCKAKIYLHDLNIEKCITILRQISRLFGKTVDSNQRYLNNKKTTYYVLRDDDVVTDKKIRMTQRAVRIEFS